MNKPLLLMRLNAPTPYLSVGSLIGDNYILKKCAHGCTSVQPIGHRVGTMVPTFSNDAMYSLEIRDCGG